MVHTSQQHGTVKRQLVDVGANSGFVIPHLIEGDNLAGMGGQTAAGIMSSDRTESGIYVSAQPEPSARVNRDSTSDRKLSLHGEGHEGAIMLGIVWFCVAAITLAVLPAKARNRLKVTARLL